jgi:hypothetical protein
MFSIRLAAALAVVASPAALNAATVVTVHPTGAAASSYYQNYPQGDAIDRDFNFENSDWAATGEGAGAFIDVDLGREVTIVGGHIVDRVTSGWDNNAFVGGLYDYTTSFSLQAISGYFGTLQGAAQVYTFGLPNTPTDYSSFTHDIAIAPITTRYVRYTVLATQGVNPGLSDLSFSATPEPAEWALMIGGFGLVGAASRRRKLIAA